MNKLFLLCSILFLTTVTYAQTSLSPNVKSEKIDDHTYLLSIDIKAHKIYSKSQEKGFPVLPFFKIPHHSKITLIGPLKEIGVLKKDSTNGRLDRYYESKVTWQQKVGIKDVPETTKSLKSINAKIQVIYKIKGEKNYRKAEADIVFPLD